MSQVANTYWVNRAGEPANIGSAVRRGIRLCRFIDYLILMVVLAAAAICFSIYWRTNSELAAAAIKHKAAADRVAELKAEAERLEREVHQLRTNARVIESFARQNLGLVRAGEIVIKLEQEQKPLPAGPGETRMANLTPRINESYTKLSN